MDKVEMFFEIRDKLIEIYAPEFDKTVDICHEYISGKNHINVVEEVDEEELIIQNVFHKKLVDFEQTITVKKVTAILHIVMKVKHKTNKYLDSMSDLKHKNSKIHIRAAHDEVLVEFIFNFITTPVSKALLEEFEDMAYREAVEIIYF